MPHYNLPHNHGQNIEKVLNKMPSAEGFKDISFLFQQLGDPTRLRILWLLCHCEECVCNLAAAVDMSAPAVSHHLRILKKSGIISSRRDGKEVYYTLVTPSIFFTAFWILSAQWPQSRSSSLMVFFMEKAPFHFCIWLV